jgi:hypothetical protein
VILACTVVMWALLSFPRDEAAQASYETNVIEATDTLRAGPELDARLAELGHERASLALRHSFGGRIGHAIEPAIEPLGFDWKIGIGLLGAFAAREVFVSTMGVVYGMGGDVDEDAVGLRQRIQQESRSDGRPVYTPARRPLPDGLLRHRLPVHEHPRRRAPRDQGLALADLPVRLHRRARLAARLRRLPRRPRPRLRLS